MRIYLAAGFSIMLVPGLEKELREKFGGDWNRLVSYYHTQLHGEKIIKNIMNLKEDDGE